MSSPVPGTQCSPDTQSYRKIYEICVYVLVLLMVVDTQVRSYFSPYCPKHKTLFDMFEISNGSWPFRSR